MKKLRYKIPDTHKKWRRLLFVICITFISLGILYCFLSIAWPQGLAWLSQKENSMTDIPSKSGILKQAPKAVEPPDWVIQDYLTPNEYSRPMTPLYEVRGVVVHYVGNPGTTAQGNKSYFEQLATTKDTYASSHFIIGPDGEVIQCIPLNEIAYCSNHRNSDTISIECCHPDAEGQFNTQTYDALLRLTDWLCQTYDLNPTVDVIRHYDVTGKECPKYYVDHPEAWQQFLMDLNDFE